MPYSRARDLWSLEVWSPLKARTPAAVRALLAGRKLTMFGERESQLLKFLVEPGTVAIDVGANLGSYTFLLANLVGHGGRVLAIEPQPKLAEMIARGAKQLNLPVAVVRAAASSHPGTSTLNIPVHEGMLNTALASMSADLSNQPHVTQAVSLVRLDDLISETSPRVSFLKIDVEGHEFQVLTGANRILSDDRPNILIELEDRWSSQPLQEKFDLLHSYQYKGAFLDPNGTLRSLEQFDVERDQRIPLKQGNSRGYINNFIFFS